MEGGVDYDERYSPGVSPSGSPLDPTGFAMTRDRSANPAHEAEPPIFRLGQTEKETLREVAWRSIDLGLAQGRPLDVKVEEYPSPLQDHRATFVTLEVEGRLRGCIGTCLPRHPLVRDVAENAFAAAFRDHRFSPLTEAERKELDLHISLLSPLEPLEIGSERELIRALRPGMDGLLLEDPPHRSTFLPRVWESLPSPREFLTQLKLKAGLPRDHWSADLRFYRYSAEEF